MKILYNGEIIDESEAPILISDKAVWYDWGVYETMKVIQGVILFPQEHIARLFNSAKLVDLNIGFDEKQIITWIHKYADNLNLQDNLIKICVYADSDKNQTSRFYIFALGLTFYPEKYYKQGVSAILVEGERFMPQSKTMSTLQAFLARKKAKENQAFEALKVDSKGNIREGAATNIFMVTDGQLITPPDDVVLSGVTRDHVLHIAGGQSIPVFKRAISKDQLFRAEEVFITGTVSNILPIVKVDNSIIGDGSVGPVTLNLQKKYRIMQKEYIQKNKQNEHF